MSDAISVGIAKAVTSLIDAATLSQDFTPERSYAEWELDLSKQAKDSGWELSDADKLHVDVVAHTTQQDSELSGRGFLRYSVPVQIAIRKKFGQEAQDDDTGRIAIAKIDELIKLTEEIHVLLTEADLDDQYNSKWNDAPKIIAAPVKAHLRQISQFTGIIEGTFDSHVSV